MSMPASGGAQAEGAAAEAIRAAETALAQQNSVTAQVDLAVVTAVLNAHTAHTDGAAALESLQREIEAAVATRTALDTPAGAREFQRYLIDKLEDIRAVVEDTDLDDTSKASLAAALASLYASAGSGGAAVEGTGNPTSSASPTPSRSPASITASSQPPAAGLDAGLDPGLSDFGPLGFPGPDLVPETGADTTGADMTGTVPPTPAPPAGQSSPLAPMMPAAPALPSLGGGPSGASPLDGLSSLPALAALADPSGPAPDLRDEVGDEVDDAVPEPAEPESLEPESEAAPQGAGGDETEPPFAGVIAAAVAGTPIADAFNQQGIVIPGPGTPVIAPLLPEDVVPGDVGLFDDRHALALGNGKVLLDDQIQPIETVNRQGFIGWQHPPEPDRTAEPDR
jgi:hypothetical protein